MIELEAATAGELIAQLAVTIREDYVPNRERSVALTKLDELRLWLSEATVSDERPSEHLVGAAARHRANGAGQSQGRHDG